MALSGWRLRTQNIHLRQCWYHALEAPASFWDASFFCLSSSSPTAVGTIGTKSTGGFYWPELLPCREHWKIRVTKQQLCWWHYLVQISCLLVFVPFQCNISATLCQPPFNQLHNSKFTVNEIMMELPPRTRERTTRPGSGARRSSTRCWGDTSQGCNSIDI